MDDPVRLRELEAMVLADDDLICELVGRAAGAT